MSEKPIIRMLSLRGKSRAGGMTGGGLNLALTALNIAADELPFDEKELYHFLHFRIDTVKKAESRSRWIGAGFTML